MAILILAGGQGSYAQTCSVSLSTTFALVGAAGITGPNSFLTFAINGSSSSCAVKVTSGDPWLRVVAAPPINFGNVNLQVDSNPDPTPRDGVVTVAATGGNTATFSVHQLNATNPGACVDFPAKLIPFSQIFYVSGPNAAGDRLVVGSLQGGLNAIGGIPLPSAPNETFCSIQIQLGPQGYYPNVYVPTAAERGGDFSAFSGLLLDPITNQPFPAGIIPASRLGGLYAWRIGPPGFLSLSQNGVTFQAVAGSTADLQRNVLLISTSTVIAWTTAASTVSGGDWLRVTPSTGSSAPNQPAPVIQITANPSKLAAGVYYGTVTVTSTGPQQFIYVVLSVATPDRSPGAALEPTGVAFLGSPGGGTPAARTIQIVNPTTIPLTFTTTFTSSTPIRWFQFAPASGTENPGVPGLVSIQPNAGLAAGTYTGTIAFLFSDGNTRVLNLLAIIAPGASGVYAPNPERAFAAAACTPTKLQLTFTLLGANFNSPVAFPSDIEGFVADDCGTPIATGTVTATFSNGDPALPMISQQTGRWSNTWTPRGPLTNLTVTLTAQTVIPALQGATSVSGNSPPNPNVPLIGAGGIVGTASFAPSPAPGTLISIFGTALADGVFSAAQLPLPNLLGTTQVFAAGIRLPVLFVSPNQINAQVPYKLNPGVPYSVFVRRGTANSTGETISIQDAQPAAFSTDQTGTGQGHIYRITRDGQQILASAESPVTAGDVLTVYCTGLGEVTPAGVVAGAPAPLDVLENAASSVAASIGGVQANVLFAGLTPGFTGLYQVNLVVPPGVTPGSSVPMALIAGGRTSQTVTLAVR